MPRVRKHFKHWRSFSESSTIHGLQYLAERGRPKSERVCWVIIMVISLCGSGLYINKSWTKWKNSPVIISFSESSTPIWHVPFPAITICSETKSRATVYNFSGNYCLEPETLNDFNLKGDVSLLCDPHILVNNSKTTNESTVTALHMLGPQLNETAYICKWMTDQEECRDILTEFLTDEGICFTYNLLNSSELFKGDGNILAELKEGSWFPDRPKTRGWSPEGGYDAGFKMDVYPRRTLEAGVDSGFSIVLAAMPEDFDYLCRRSIQGFKILLHNPVEMPSLGERYIRLPFHKEVMLEVTPQLMETSPELRQYAPHLRQCYFSNEKYLAHFKVYTQRNCQLECLTNYTNRKCGCVAFYMPRTENDTMCGPASKACMIQAKDELRKSEVDLSYSSIFGNPCNCLPACSSLDYDVSISQANFQWMDVVMAFEDPSEFESYSLARFTVYFKSEQFYSSQRTEFISTADFYSLCGGILGLFSGLSLLSLAEILYYLTLEIWHHMSRNKN